MKLKVGYLLFFIFLVLIFQQAEIDSESTQKVFQTEPNTEAFSSPVPNVIGDMRPEFSLPDIYGIQHPINEWDGKVVAVNFWATWCLPCLKEIPELIALQSLYGAKGFQVIGIALQKQDDLLNQFIVQHKISYPVLVGEAPVIIIAENFGNRVGALPYTAILDRVGTVVFTKVGPITRDEVEGIVKELL